MEKNVPKSLPSFKMDEEKRLKITEQEIIIEDNEYIKPDEQ